jgi:hypothetical protein
MPQGMQLRRANSLRPSMSNQGHPPAPVPVGTDCPPAAQEKAIAAAKAMEEE